MKADHASQLNQATTVFLSYSRADAKFVEYLAEALAARGYAPVFDRSNYQFDDPELRLTAQDEWWRTLQTMIAASDVMVFVVTPESAASRVCDDEIAYAKSLGKRVVAVLRKAIDFDTAPERLRALNIAIDFSLDDPRTFASAVDALNAELTFDIEWMRQGSRLVRQAQHWQEAGRPEAYLLRDGAVQDADRWISRRHSTAPEAATIVIEFIESSREKERLDRTALRLATLRGYVRPAEQHLKEGRVDVALRHVVAASVIASDYRLQLSPELRGVAYRALCTRLKVRIPPGPRRSDIQFDMSGGTLTISEPDGIRLWDLRSYAATNGDGGNVELYRYKSVRRMEELVSPDGRYVAHVEAKSELTVRATSDGKTVFFDRNLRDSISSICFSPDSSRLAIFGMRESKVVSVATPDEEPVLLEAVDGSKHMDRDGMFTADGQLLVVCGRYGTRLHNALSGIELSKLDHADDAVRVRTSPDPRRAAVLYRDGSVRVWDLALNIEKFREPYPERHFILCGVGIWVDDGSIGVATAESMMLFFGPRWESAIIFCDRWRSI